MSKDNKLSENANERDDSDRSQQTQQGRQGGGQGSTQRNDSAVGHTPSKAEGDEGDVDEALRRQ
jgi:hypothetical protein